MKKLFLASVTTYENLNPSFRVFEVDSETY